MNIRWLTADDERLEMLWPGALGEDPDALALLLESARVQCEAYAPALGDDDLTEIHDTDGESYMEPPKNYLHAQALQARALARAAIADDGKIGFGDHPVPIFPMDWTVQRLLRPQTRPAIA